MGSIYTQTRQRTFVIQPGQVLDVTLDGWQANTVIVDSYTSQYLFIEDAPKYVDPNTRHAVIALPSVSTARAIYQAPPGITQPSPGPSDECRLTFLEDGHPTNPGYNPAIDSAVFLGSLIAPVGTFTGFSFIPDPKITAIAWVEDSQFGGNPVGYELFGNNTNTSYFFANTINNVNFPPIGSIVSPWVVEISSGDTEPKGYTLILDATTSIASCRIFIYGLRNQAVVNIRQNATDVLFVSNANALPGDFQSPNGNSLFSGQPKPFVVNSALAAGASAQLATAGLTNGPLRLFSITYTIDEGVAVNRFLAWEQTPSNTIWWQDSFLSSVGTRSFNYHGGAVTDNSATQGIRIHNNGGVIVTARGTMGVSNSL